MSYQYTYPISKNRPVLRNWLLVFAIVSDIGILFMLLNAIFDHWVYAFVVAGCLIVSILLRQIARRFGCKINICFQEGKLSVFRAYVHCKKVVFEVDLKQDTALIVQDGLGLSYAPQKTINLSRPHPQKDCLLLSVRDKLYKFETDDYLYALIENALSEGVK